MRRITFEADGWEHYLYWQQHDKQMLKRINALLKEIQRTPESGTGKPERLKHELSGAWSRRIDHRHRLVYRFDDKTVIVHYCKDHY